MLVSGLGRRDNYIEEDLILRLAACSKLDHYIDLLVLYLCRVIFMSERYCSFTIVDSPQVEEENVPLLVEAFVVGRIFKILRER